MKMTIKMLLMTGFLGFCTQVYAETLNNANLNFKGEGLQEYKGAVALPETLSPWLVRIRVLDVVPSANSSVINGIGGKVTGLSSTIVPEIDLTYFLNANLATELILATSKHNVHAKNTTLGNVSLGSVYLLPPTVTLQYHFFSERMFRPYVGAGINYTYFYKINYGPVAQSVSYSNSFGPALQVGLDIGITKNWLINLDIKKIFIESNVNVQTGATTVLNTDVKINPTIFGLGIGYRFS